MRAVQKSAWTRKSVTVRGAFAKLPFLVAETSDLGTENMQLLSHCFKKQW